MGGDKKTFFYQWIQFVETMVCSGDDHVAILLLYQVRHADQLMQTMHHIQG